jgi:GNAT superfamily N-acetyltransferase
MFIYCYNEKSQMVGYICFFPISDTLNLLLLKNDTMFDDNIKAEDIIQFSKDVEHNIFIISIAVLKEYRGLGIGCQLVKKMFAYLNKLTNAGIKIDKVYGTTISYDGFKLLSKFNFDVRRTYSDYESLMVFEYLSFNDMDLYLFLPVKILGGFKKNNGVETNFISSLKETCNREMSSLISSRIERTFLNRVFIAIYDDLSNDLDDYKIDANLYLSRYKDTGTVILEFASISIDPTYIQDQESRNMIYVWDGENQILIQDFLLKMNIEIISNSTSLLVSNQKLNEYYRRFVLASEAYFNFIGSKIISKSIIEAAKSNIAQYDFADIYVSSRNIVFELLNPNNDYKQRLNISILMIFIQELLSLEIAAVKNAERTILVEFDNSPKPSTAIIEEIIDDFGKYIILYEYNFNYLLAKILSDRIADEFGIELMLKKYRTNIDQLNKIITIRSERISKKFSKKQDLLFKIIAVFSLLLSINNFIELFFDQKFDSVKDIISFSISILVWISASLYLLITWIKFRKRD